MAKRLLFDSRIRQKKFNLIIHSMEKKLAAILLVFVMYEIQ